MKKNVKSNLSSTLKGDNAGNNCLDFSTLDIEVDMIKETINKCSVIIEKKDKNE
ncbi:hypothetical protein R2R35_18605 [Anaerocolumna sp. AGMB13020]|uniref:hypothetical protein n=1 Tax=Anaerocolumna sp. AGMB13020 TaxID=3081750 RepID=UPI00295349A0|nr:hypothetical protein [Anaerocolumna sp. AGMB13020]WOO35793.1 hypothetical protein R2R35_18605 [Anaerocolumna sp. AGMB13020]